MLRTSVTLLALLLACAPAAAGDDRQAPAEGDCVNVDTHGTPPVLVDPEQCRVPPGAPVLA